MLDDDHGVRLERHGHVALVTLDRPERRNAMDVRMWDTFDAVLDDLERQLPRAVVITGAGEKAFCAGMDVNPDNPLIQSVVQAVQHHDTAPVSTMLERLVRTIQRFVTLPVPTIAALNGLAFGGGAELAAQCDLRVMDPTAVFCFSEVRLGLMPDWGGGVALARLLGPSRAADLILTARKVDAAEALALGLANRVSAPGQALAEAMSLAETIAANGPRAVRGALEVIRTTPGRDQREAMEFEFARAVALIASGECVHGIGAFLGRTAPTFPDIDPDR